MSASRNDRRAAQHGRSDALRARETRLLAGIAREVEQVLNSVTRLRDAMLVLVGDASSNRRLPCTEDLRALRPLIAEVLRRHEGFAAGAGIVFAPEVLTDAPRWIEWWWGDRGAGLERLEVDLDPDSAEFYDYTSAEWYREPERTGAQAIAGPYVDYICTHAYTFTLAVPIVCEDRFIGVAGADILAVEVERAVVPGLARLEGVAVLASAEGRVIASNTARYLPGAVVTPQDYGDGPLRVATPQTLPGTRSIAFPWRLLVD
jgi:hypothetical protein